MDALRHFRAIEWRDRTLWILDQTLLPEVEKYVPCRTVGEVADAIRSMRVRGAPAIGIAAAAGMALAAREAEQGGLEVESALGSAGTLFISTRPTAVNLRWAVDRARQAAANAAGSSSASDRLERLVTELLDEQATTDQAIAAHGVDLVPAKARVLTHCNTGALATGAYGTAFAVIHAAFERGLIELVYADESRPRLQGARLTAWELGRLGIPYRLLPDVAAASLMARGMMDAVIVGADRIAANGDVANKIGTYPLAISARYHRIPFYVAAPVSTFDLDCPTGAQVPIEERDQDEVHVVGRERISPPGAQAINPAFDVTPADLITAIVTEHGVLRPPFPTAIAALPGASAVKQQKCSSRAGEASNRGK